ncbi:MAG: PKD domain-containing protein [Bacteroidales bacterium]|nr:PKD domain-containing protein [Bacteroidales bacterium]
MTENKVLTYTWDFGDGTRSYEERTYHCFLPAGTYTINLKASNNEKTGEATLYAKVYGKIPGDKSTYSKGYIIWASENYIYSFYGTRSSLNLIKMEDTTLLYNREIKYYDEFIDVFDFMVDKDKNFILLEDNGLSKINTNADLLKKVNIYSGNQGHIIQTNKGNFLITEIDGYNVTGLKYNNLLEFQNKTDLYKNDQAPFPCTDLCYINDSAYVMIVNENPNDYYPNHNEKFNILKKTIKNDTLAAIPIEKRNLYKIHVTSTGYLIYGFNIDWSCGGCNSYLNFLKLSSDFKQEWIQQVDLGTEGFDNNNFDAKISCREYNDHYLIFHENKVISLQKTGTSFTSDIIFPGIDFRVKSVCPNGENTLVLGDIYNSSFYDLFNTEHYPVIITLNSNGKLIN